MSVVDWFADGEHWSGSDGVPARLVEHLSISGTAVAFACLVAIPLGVTLGHFGRGGTLAINVSNIGRAIPTFGILVLLATSGLGIGDRPAIVALTLFGIPPLLTNTYVGMRGVDADVRESARGMGMTRWQLLARVEVPLAVPLIAAGLRTAAVQIVATTSLAAIVAGGGLGRFIIDGLARQDEDMVVAGGLLVAGLALLTEGALAVVERAVTPGGRRQRLDPRLDLPQMQAQV